MIEFEGVVLDIRRVEGWGQRNTPPIGTPIFLQRGGLGGWVSHQPSGVCEDAGLYIGGGMVLIAKAADE